VASGRVEQSHRPVAAVARVRLSGLNATERTALMVPKRPLAVSSSTVMGAPML
jgi:hypothetical protein